MIHDLQKLSEQLQAAHDRLADQRHGGVILAGDDLEETIQSFRRFARLARSLETKLSESERLQRTGFDCRVLVNGRGAAVLSAFRGETSNVVPLIRRSTNDTGDTV
ncbi:hypothetical protein ACQKGC_05705 [Allorhizobium pseudoryzae]|uniref:hypothetical protein n=1 Tax=Allorhizobium pseudoryzae TaxID=379684 RepID=UPI003D086CD9